MDLGLGGLGNGIGVGVVGWWGFSVGTHVGVYMWRNSHKHKQAEIGGVYALNESKIKNNIKVQIEYNK